MQKKIYRPRGCGYIMSVIAVSAVLAAVAGLSVWLFVVRQSLTGSVLAAVAVPGAVWLSADVAAYKITVSDSGVVAAQYRMLTKIVQDKITLVYDGLCEIKKTFASDENGRSVCAVALFYSDGTFRFLNVKRFSDAQIRSVMSDIKRRAEVRLSREVLMSVDCDDDKF